MQRYIAFDVEMPNSRNDRMSAIGLAVIEDGRIKRTFSSLINPETYFSYFNIALTGITPGSVADAPDFGELWEAIGPLMQSGILAAHNAPFDMSVLAKCLRAYCIDAPLNMDYVCTVRMGKRAYPLLPDHKLDTLCRFLDIPLDHHRADSDAEACARLLIDYERRGLNVGEFVRSYDMLKMCTVKSRCSK